MDGGSSSEVFESPESPPPMKKIKLENETSVNLRPSKGGQSLHSLWTKRIENQNSQRHVEFYGRLASDGNKAKLYPDLDDEPPSNSNQANNNQGGNQGNNNQGGGGHDRQNNRHNLDPRNRSRGGGNNNNGGPKNNNHHNRSGSRGRDDNTGGRKVHANL